MPVDPIEEAIINATHDAEDGVVDTPAAEGVESAETTEVSPSAVVESAAAVPAVTTDDEELKKELEAAGIKPPVAGQRENRLPWTRVQKILENTRKKLKDSHAAATKTFEEKFAVADAKGKQMDLVDNLIATDPDRYIKELARIHPDKYGKYLTAGAAQQSAAAAATTVAATTAVGDKPAPDAKFPDGSIGYSPDQHEKLMAWHEAKAEERAVTRVTKDLETRFGPMEKQFKAQQVHNQNRPIVQAQMDAAKKVWGRLFVEGQTEIAAAMKATPGLSLDAACAQVLVPKTAAQRDAMRAEIIKEIKARPAAAARTVPGSTTAAVVADGDPIEAAIRKAIASVR